MKSMRGEINVETLLLAKDITKIYNKNQKPGLNHVSFEIHSGEFIGIMGASGSGKTTMLNVLSTIDTPTSGEIIINGINLRKLKDNHAADFRRDHLGFIFQEYFLLDSLTVKENISVPLTLQHKSPGKIESSIQRLAERFEIVEQLSKYPSELSGGQKQRVAAARAIVKNPSILFADEPTGALDSNSATELLKKLSEVNLDLHTTILMVTHDAYAASFANRILIFKDGQIIKELKKTIQERKAFFEEIISEIATLNENR
jgi:putative ABC transport system ATP-binding protein